MDPKMSFIIRFQCIIDTSKGCHYIINIISPIKISTKAFPQIHFLSHPFYYIGLESELLFEPLKLYHMKAISWNL